MTEAIPQELLVAEEQALQHDRELYLDCLNDKPLKERQTPQEIRDGLILFHHVYRLIKTRQEEDAREAKAASRLRKGPGADGGPVR
jgi:hypothetical protein